MWMLTAARHSNHLNNAALGDRVQRKPLLFAFAVIGTPLGLIYLFPVKFTVVIILSIYGSVTGALLGCGWMDSHHNVFVLDRLM
jgi:hypothetical protein